MRANPPVVLEVAVIQVQGGVGGGDVLDVAQVERALVSQVRALFQQRDNLRVIDIVRGRIAAGLAILQP